MSKIHMIDPELQEKLMLEAQEALDELNNAKNLTTKDKLFREYMITLCDNPTPVNLVLYLSGRPESMKRR
jgi:hypothetical protein